MTQEEIIEMARQAGFVDYELDDGTTNAFDKRYEAFAKLVAEKAIKEALAQPEQYPQIAINPEIVGYVAPQRTWVGLTDEEMMDAIYVDDTPMERGRRVEAKLRSKNT